MSDSEKRGVRCHGCHLHVCGGSRARNAVLGPGGRSWDRWWEAEKTDFIPEDRSSQQLVLPYGLLEAAGSFPSPKVSKKTLLFQQGSCWGSSRLAWGWGLTAWKG